MSTYQVPGVYRVDVAPAASGDVRTGVPLFAGLATSGPGETAACVDSWPEFSARFGGLAEGGFLADAVHGFFANGGTRCRVLRLAGDGDPVVTLVDALEATAELRDVDLVCVPDASRLWGEDAPDPARVQAVQRAAIDHCEGTGRFAILDSVPSAGPAAVLEQRRPLTSSDASLYYPWIRVQRVVPAKTPFVPPCGHVAGIYAATDARVGVHKAPANEIVREALGLETAVDDGVQAGLNPVGVNCLRSFPGRGIRVWGARTLSAEPAWSDVSVRRVALTVARWAEADLGAVLFEPNDETLRSRVRRELSAHLAELHRRGALQGEQPEEAFFVRCDAAANPSREPGRLVVEVGLAPLRPNEFVVVHLVHEAGGVSVLGPIGSH